MAPPRALPTPRFTGAVKPARDVLREPGVVDVLQSERRSSGLDRQFSLVHEHDGDFITNGIASSACLADEPSAVFREKDGRSFIAGGASQDVEEFLADHRLGSMTLFHICASGATVTQSQYSPGRGFRPGREETVYSRRRGTPADCIRSGRS